MSSASESACSRDGEGDTELDLDVNILPQQGCARPGPHLPGSAGKRDEGRGARTEPSGGVPASREAERPRPGAAASKRAGHWTPREGGAGRAAGGWGSGLQRAGQELGGEGRSASGRQHLPLPPATAPILVAPIGWEWQVSRREAGLGRQSGRAPAGGPGSVRPEGPCGSQGPGSRSQRVPAPALAPNTTPGSLWACSADIETGATSALRWAWRHSCRHLLASGWRSGLSQSVGSHTPA